MASCTETAVYPATHTVHWPSGPVNACEDHARKLVGLARFMGSHVGVTTAPAGAECTNCVNEAAKPDGGIGAHRDGTDV